METELSTVRALEEAFSVEYLDFIQSYQHLDSEQVLIKQQIKNTAEQLERLKYTNVMDDGFPISSDGHFGTICGFRLGKLPSQAIDWAEMSAGFGQVVLLIQTLSKQLGCKFTKYRLLPLGSFSRMAKIDDPSNTYELYGSQDVILGRLFWYRRFDQVRNIIDAATKHNTSYHHHDDRSSSYCHSLQTNGMKVICTCMFIFGVVLLCADVISCFLLDVCFVFLSFFFCIGLYMVTQLFETIRRFCHSS